MNQYPKINENKNKNTFFIVLTFILLSFGTAFGQTALENDAHLNSTLTTDSIETIAVKQDEASSSNSNMNFVLWFMGSKQDPNAKIVPTGNTTKKQFMTSGTAPNRLLIKAFLKKAVNFESAVV